ncbi:pyridoxamine 5'-phosphate oxidase family protein [Paraburkholderia kururiensis]|uniref:Pyridoxamine 5'-phosphate oxidase family protein n=1 Tax=Paraburkholderia kururiensis TaxID=984307 RepID=A0ABZ0WRW3_9BURK|nr:pyridoxamine 5'-phosphate oxidase family protein [Paraburkholderia kururiensis]WQD79975.1 pyridoxamine 5'-phosphate oxidase family protein [Paraburkholderia kururiensis]
MNLEQIYARIWDSLAASVREDSLPFKVMQAGTIGLDGSPNVRTVLLRGVSERENLLTFHTDLRSPKVAELSREPRIALVAVDAARSQQIRVSGEARIVRDGQARLDAWHASPDHDLIAYRTRLAPGTPMRHADDALGASHDPHDVPGPAEGFQHFCVVEVRPARLDWLDLSGARPLRACYAREGDRWIHRWIAP